MDGKMPMNTSSVIAIYYDKDGKALQFEDLKNVSDRCVTGDKREGVPDCPPGFRELFIGGVRYCIRI
jgi:hypothetical protein